MSNFSEYPFHESLLEATEVRSHGTQLTAEAFERLVNEYRAMRQRILSLEARLAAPAQQPVVLTDAQVRDKLREYNPQRLGDDKLPPGKRPLYQYEIDENVYPHEQLFYSPHRLDGEWITACSYYDSRKTGLGGLLEAGFTIVVAYEARHPFHNPECYEPRLAEDEGLRLIYGWEWAHKIYHGRHDMLHWYDDRHMEWRRLVDHPDYKPDDDIDSEELYGWTFAVGMADAYRLHKQGLLVPPQAQPAPPLRKRRALNV